MREKITADLKTAMKAGDRAKVDALRLINAGLKDKDIEARGLGKSLGEFKKAKEDFEKELHSAASTDSTNAPATPALDEKRTPPAGTQPVTGAGSTDELTKKL